MISQYKDCPMHIALRSKKREKIIFTQAIYGKTTTKKRIYISKFFTAFTKTSSTVLSTPTLRFREKSTHLCHSYCPVQLLYAATPRSTLHTPLSQALCLIGGIPFNFGYFLSQPFGGFFHKHKARASLVITFRSRQRTFGKICVGFR